MSEIKKAILVFHYTEKIKSNLILTFSLLDVLDGMRDEEISGAEKLLVAYFNALIRETVKELGGVAICLCDFLKETKSKS